MLILMILSLFLISASIPNKVEQIASVANVVPSTATEIVAVSQGGTIGISASSDGGVQVWDLVSHRLVRTLSTDGVFQDLAISADGFYLAILDYSASVRVLDLRSGATVRNFEAPENSATDSGKVYFSPKADVAVTVWGRNVVYLDPLSGAVQVGGKFPNGASLSVIDNGKAAFIEINANSVVIGDVAGHGRTELPIAGATWAKLSSDGTRIIVGDSQGLTLWNVQSVRPLTSIDRIAAGDASPAVVARSDAFAYIFRQESIVTVDLRDGSIIGEFANKFQQGRSSSANASWLMFVDETGRVHLIDRNGSASTLGVRSDERPGLAFADNDTLLVGSPLQDLGRWNLSKSVFERIPNPHRTGSASPTVASSGANAAWVSSDGSVQIADTKDLSRPMSIDGAFTKSEATKRGGQCQIALKSGEKSGFVISENSAVRFDDVSDHRLTQIYYGLPLDYDGCVAISADEKYIVVGASSGHQIYVISTATGELLRTLPTPDIGGPPTWMAFSQDGNYLFFAVENSGWGVLDFRTGQYVAGIEDAGLDKKYGGFRVGAVVGLGMVVGDFSGNLHYWRMNESDVQSWRAHDGPVGALAASYDGKLLASAGADGKLKLWLSVGAEWALLGQFAAEDDGDWVFLAPDGRIDAANLRTIAGLSWVAADDPLRALSPEIFMRDYYEPNLLGRLLACHQAEASGKSSDACAQAFKPVRSLESLNRIQPDVRIISVKSGPTPDVALVEVEASGKASRSQMNGKTSTGVYDVRLFRDGQLVDQWPEPKDDQVVAGDDLEAWRRVSQVEMPDGKIAARHVFSIRLAHGDAGKKVMFTAYGFNEDRVKSATASDNSYVVPDDLGRAADPRAYLVTVGVNKYQNEALRLSFAAADAGAIASALRGIKGYDLVPVLLTSDYARTDGKQQISPVDNATKTNIRDVLGLLAGKAEAERPRLRQEVGPVIDRLAKVTPDDLVILAFSGHGYTEHGRFYILPSDSGNDLARLDQLISSEELTAWLRDVDAGEMVMIVDACHSAAGVPAGFKPGPMGDRGLGQLAYDKGMRILAATQADDVALESGALGQGLLTYALKEGLAGEPGAHVRADIDGDGTVTMKEWLTYAEARVPSLYQDVLAGKVRKTRDSKPDPDLLEDTTRHAQTPALFDFVRTSGPEPVIAVR